MSKTMEEGFAIMVRVSFFQQIKKLKEGKKVMALKLSLKKSVFPVEIGTFKFEVDLSDDKAKELEEKVTTFLKGISDLAGSSENEEEFAALLAHVFDALLGEGAYEKLYGYAKRVDLLAELLEELILALVSKLPGRLALVDAVKATKQADGQG